MEYVEITFNEKTKKNQGSDNSTSKRALHDNHHIISAMPGNELCPVESFKCYLTLLNHEQSAFFQYPNKKLNGFNNAAIGKNSLGTMMKEISKEAKLSKIYTNHCIRKTTATALKWQGFELNEISHITKHKNLDSVKHYIGGLTYSDKRRYNEAMSNYASTENDTPPQKRPSSDCVKETVKTQTNCEKNATKHAVIASPVVKSVPNVNPSSENCLIPMFPDSEESACTSIDDDTIIPLNTQNQQNHQNVMNQLRHASHFFQNANFNNCNFTFQMPKWRQII